MYAGDVDTLCHLAAFLTIRKSQHREAAILYDRALLVAPDCTVCSRSLFPAAAKRAPVSRKGTGLFLYERALLVAPDCTVYIQTMCVCVHTVYVHEMCVCVCVCVCVFCVVYIHKRCVCVCVCVCVCLCVCVQVVVSRVFFYFSHVITS
jgi:hypothetical protein